MNKAHSPINWQNKPSINTPINETNLNKMDNEIGVIDDRVVAMDTSKANSSDVLAMFSNASYNENTGVITFTRANGTTVTIDTKLEKLAVNFSYDATRQKLIITLDDGTTQEVDMSALINEYDFQTSDTVSFTVVNGKVKAEVVDGSITADKLQPNYLADIRVEVAKAEGAGAQADLAKSYAVGGTGTRAGEDTDNAKYYAQRAEAVSKVDIATTAKAGIVKPDGTTITVDADGTIHGQGGLTNVSWDDIDDKPNSFPPSAHQHQVSDITDFPATMPPSAHQHQVNDIADMPDWAKSANKPDYTANEVGAVATAVVGDAYNASTSYAIGDYCIYNNGLYKCKVACVGQIPTNSTYWIATSINNELKTKNIVTTTAPTAGATSTYPVGTTIDVIE